MPFTPRISISSNTDLDSVALLEALKMMGQWLRGDSWWYGYDLNLCIKIHIKKNISACIKTDCNMHDNWCFCKSNLGSFAAHMGWTRPKAVSSYLYLSFNKHKFYMTFYIWFSLLAVVFTQSIHTKVFSKEHLTCKYASLFLNVTHVYKLECFKNKIALYLICTKKALELKMYFQ